jgi:hypothetical protein
LLFFGAAGGGEREKKQTPAHLLPS